MWCSSVVLVHTLSIEHTSPVAGWLKVQSCNSSSNSMFPHTQSLHISRYGFALLWLACHIAFSLVCVALGQCCLTADHVQSWWSLATHRVTTRVATCSRVLGDFFDPRQTHLPLPIIKHPGLGRGRFSSCILLGLVWIFSEVFDHWRCSRVPPAEVAAERLCAGWSVVAGEEEFFDRTILSEAGQGV